MELAILRRSLERCDNAPAFGDLASSLGFLPEAHPVNYLADSSASIHSRVAPAATGLFRVGSLSFPIGAFGFWVADLKDWGQRSADRDRARRRITKALVELAPADDQRFLLVLRAPGQNDLELVLPRVRPDKSFGTVRAVINRKEPTNHHLQLLADLVLETGISSTQAFRRWSEAFNVEKVAKRFYEEFRELRDRFLKELKRSNPTIVLLKDPVDKDEVRRYATRNLGRILFLWFLQSKRWLDGDHKYFVNLYERRCRSHEDHNFFRDTLIPLFFEALAKKKPQRGAAARDLGDVPFLNGGLFLQSRFEDQLYGEDRENLRVTLPNSLFDPRNHSSQAPSVLGLLNSYRFTTRESTPDDQSVDPDPELLGKVFENLNEESERAETGTFYTPREVVRFMCREALDGYLEERTGFGRDTFTWLRSEAIDPGAGHRHLPAEDRKKIHDALDGVTVCDPAVGSGAFPVGMMQEILLLKRGLEQSADVTVDIGGQRVAEWKEHIITNCLYGVDINPEGVEICHLRLWLSLVIDAKEPVPLPNLDFRFVAGDSLVDRIGTEPLPESLPRQLTQSKLALGPLAGLPALEEEIRSLRVAFVQSATPSEARQLRERIKKKQIQAVKIQIDAAIQYLQEATNASSRDLAKLERHGAVQKAVNAKRREIEHLESEIAKLERLKGGLDPWAPYKKPFLWPVEFPEVFDRDGFDIVVANPPYVRQESLSSADQEIYEAAYKEVYAGTADLLVYFFARAIQALKSSAHLAFITSNKYMRVAYGEGLRRYLSRTVRIKQIVDFGDLPVFDAAAYPAIMIAQKGEPTANHLLSMRDLANDVRRAVASGGRPLNVATVREELGSLLDGEREAIKLPQASLGRSVWVLEDVETMSLLSRISENSVPLLEAGRFQVYRGVTTGHNDAFVIDEKTRFRLLSADRKIARLIEPWLRGKDITRWRARSAGLFLIFVRRGTDIAEYPAVHAHLARWKNELKPKRDSRAPGPGRKPGTYEWFEIQDSIAYFEEFSKPKIIWAKTAKKLIFAWNDDKSFCANTVHLITEAPRWILGVLNSSVSTFLCLSQVNLLRGGYIELTPSRLDVLRLPKDLKTAEATIAPIVDEIFRRLESGADISDCEENLERVVAGLLGLSEEDRAHIRKWCGDRSLGDEDGQSSDE